MKVLLFGTGRYFAKYKPFFQNVQIVGLIDNDKNKIGSVIDGVRVFSPVDAIKEEYDKIFILSKKYNGMKQQLLSLGVNENQIINYNDIKNALGNRIFQLEVIKYDSENKLKDYEHGKVALIGNDLSRTGGPLSLLRVAQILKKNGYECHCYSMEDGSIRNDFLESGIPVIVDANMLICTIDDINWIKRYDIIFMNGIHCYTLLRSCHINIPIIWWLHDPEMYYDGYCVENLNEKNLSNITVHAVSKLAAIPFEKRCPNWGGVTTLSYGIEDQYTFYDRPNVKREKIIFAIIGSCTEIKGHKILLRAIKTLPEDKRKKCEIWIVGNMESVYAKNFIKESKTVKEIKIIGELLREDMKLIYEKISVLISCSLQDVMPIVCTEAMMYCHPCIISDSVGTAEYITHGVDGLIFRKGDSADLAEKMIWMIDNFDYINEMGNNARRIYEKYFSIQKFQGDLLSTMELCQKNME